MISMMIMHKANLRGIDLNLLVVLRALLTERHITRAAEHLNMSQPAVSHALNRLRLLFKDPLLTRSGRGMQLTPRATELARTLEVVISNVTEMFDRNPFDPAKAIGRVRISATEGAISAVLLDALATMSIRAPGIEIDISSEMTRIYERLRSGEIDAALDVFFDIPQAGFCAQPLFANSLVCLTRKTSSHAGKKGISLAEYSSASHAQIIGGTNLLIEQYLREAGIKRRISLSLPSYATAAAVASRTNLILTLPEMLAERAAKMFPLAIKRLPLKLPKVTLALIWHQRSDADVVQKWVRQQILSKGTAVAPSRAGARPSL